MSDENEYDPGQRWAFTVKGILVKKRVNMR